MLKYFNYYYFRKVFCNMEQIICVSYLEAGYIMRTNHKYLSEKRKRLLISMKINPMNRSIATQSWLLLFHLYCFALIWKLAALFFPFSVKKPRVSLILKRLNYFWQRYVTWNRWQWLLNGWLFSCFVMRIASMYISLNLDTKRAKIDTIKTAHTKKTDYIFYFN